MGNALGNTIEGITRWLEGCPEGTLVPASTVLAALRAQHKGVPADSARPAAHPAAHHHQALRAAQAENLPAASSSSSWRERLWTADAECRIGRAELLEAVGRSKSWLYRHTKARAKDRIPHRKLDGELVFVVGEVRSWLRAHEQIAQVGATDGGTAHRLRVAK